MLRVWLAMGVGAATLMVSGVVATMARAQAGSDPAAWIRANPGRIRSLHLKDWSPEKEKGYRVLFGEGAAEWKNIFEAAESVGGVEYYLIEQEGSRFSELDTARRCLQSYRLIHPA